MRQKFQIHFHQSKIDPRPKRKFFLGFKTSKPKEKHQAIDYFSFSLFSTLPTLYSLSLQSFSSDWVIVIKFLSGVAGFPQAVIRLLLLLQYHLMIISFNGAVQTRGFRLEMSATDHQSFQLQREIRPIFNFNENFIQFLGPCLDMRNTKVFQQKVRI